MSHKTKEWCISDFAHHILLCFCSLFSLHQDFYCVKHNISNFHLTGSKINIIYCAPTAAAYIKHLGQVDITPILYPGSIGF